MTASDIIPGLVSSVADRVVREFTDRYTETRDRVYEVVSHGPELMPKGSVSRFRFSTGDAHPTKPGFRFFQYTRSNGNQVRVWFHNDIFEQKREKRNQQMRDWAKKNGAGRRNLKPALKFSDPDRADTVKILAAVGRPSAFDRSLKQSLKEKPTSFGILGHEIKNKPLCLPGGGLVEPAVTSALAGQISSRVVSLNQTTDSLLDVTTSLENALYYVLSPAPDGCVPKTVEEKPMKDVVPQVSVLAARLDDLEGRLKCVLTSLTSLLNSCAL